MAKTGAKKTAASKPSAKQSTASKTVARNVVAKTAAAKKTAPKKRPARKAAAPSDALSAAQRIDQKIASIGDWRGECLAELRRIIHAVDPQVIEEWKWMGTPVWSHDGMYALANPHKGKVKIMFFHGAKLSDPKKLFNASLEGGTWRAIDIREGDRIDIPALKALLRAAIAYNTAHTVPRSRGSRT